MILSLSLVFVALQKFTILYIKTSSDDEGDGLARFCWVSSFSSFGCWISEVGASCALLYIVLTSLRCS